MELNLSWRESSFLWFLAVSDRQGGPSAPEGLRSQWEGPGRQVEPVWWSLHRLVLRGLHCKSVQFTVRLVYSTHNPACVRVHRWRSGTSLSVASNRTSPRPGRLWPVTLGGWDLLSGIRQLRTCFLAPPTTTRSGTSLVSGKSVSATVHLFCLVSGMWTSSCFGLRISSSQQQLPGSLRTPKHTCNL